MQRPDGRTKGAMRPVKITTDYTMYAEGSVLIEMGNTKVICTASVEEKVPPFLEGKGLGWVTAEYAMLPRATNTRKKRDIKSLKLDGRSSEIQRLIGRALRAVVDREALGERQITIDCDVIQADGGTRCASITDQRVAGLDAGAVDHLFLIDHADREACHIVLVFRIEARHFSGLAADQRAACLTAALCDTGNHLCDLLRVVLADCNIVEEEQRLCTAAGDIVYAHGNAVDANGVVLVHQERQLELGADAIRTGNEDRILHAIEIRTEQAAEAAERTHNALGKGAFYHRLHQLDRFVACGNVNAGSLVAFRTAYTHS